MITTKFKLKGTIESGEVWINGEKLDPKPSQKVINHSPNGFSWGYGGSGPAQLALAILMKCGMDELCAQTEYQEFKWDVIANLPQTDFEIQCDISKYVNNHQQLMH